MSNNEHLILFTKPPIKGKVKTRIAKQTDDEFALTLHTFLLNRTFQTIKQINVHKTIFLAYPDINNAISEDFFGIKIQQGTDIGERMNHAFEESYKAGFNKTILIGSDVPEISEDIIYSAFHSLDTNDVCIGPAEDGGYYLIGMKNPCPNLFKDILWGTEKVFQQTVEVLETKNLSYSVLETKKDIDTLADARHYSFYKEIIHKQTLYEKNQFNV